jgi:hypothetical protein
MTVEKLLKRKEKLDEASKDPKIISMAKSAVAKMLDNDDYLTEILDMHGFDMEKSEQVAIVAMSYVRKLKSFLRTL